MKNTYKIRSASRILIAFLSLLIVASQFQNCSDVKFSSTPGKINNNVDPTGNSLNTGTTQKFDFGPASSKVDILVVVDNSGSMAVEQANLGAGFDNFISSLRGLDWQIGVITTDAYELGRFVGPSFSDVTSVYGPQYLMTPNTPDVAGVFSNTVQRTNANGTYLQGSSDERAIVTAQLNIEGRNNPEIAQGFYRDNSNLAIVILSDEDERSCGGDRNRFDCVASIAPAFEERDNPQSLMNTFSQAFGSTKNILVNAIIVKPNDMDCLQSQNDGSQNMGGKFGMIYSQLVAQTSGVESSICDNGAGSFTAGLKNISDSISESVNPRTITLDHIPKDAPKVTFLTGYSVPYKWNAGTAQITFDNYPSNSSVQIDYNF